MCLVVLGEKKHHIVPLESFDPRPAEFQNTASSSLDTFLEAMKGKGLGVSLLFDPTVRVWRNSTSSAGPSTAPPTCTPEDYNIVPKQVLQAEVASLKKSLSVSEADICRIERETREQRNSHKWFQMRRLRITASYFGEIRRRKKTTKPDSLVLRMLGSGMHPEKDSASMAWGRSNESLALEQYKKTKVASGGENFVVAPSGLWVSPDYPFLAATPDAAVFDANETQGYGFAEVKCPYKHKDVSPKEACSDQPFCCELIKVGGSDQVKLKENHPYYSQVQGQMAIGGRVWNDFIIYTNRGISIERTKTSGTAPSYLYLCHFMITVWHQRYCIQSVFLYEIYPMSNLYNILQFACALFVYKVLYNYITFSVLTLYLVRKTNVTNTIITYMSR